MLTKAMYLDWNISYSIAEQDLNAEAHMIPHNP